jgi:hypothetical protein
MALFICGRAALPRACLHVRKRYPANNRPAPGKLPKVVAELRWNKTALKQG